MIYPLMSFDRGTIVMKLQDAKNRYSGEWIAFRPSGEGQNPEGEVVIHNPERTAFDRALVEQRITGVYITFAGPLVKEGFTVIF